ncbi:MAG: aminotransferase class III-fold pyridoxal phosphate-dependent enzyme [Sphaerochaeta sp.]|nr:aminotransferase class III-fold pyridoxal phosphate-dependent enzyme [Sphaerochaeta sp.]
MICDEIQCGIGRSGDFFAFQYGDIVPDVILLSKGGRRLASAFRCGVP